jgi:hypothetical protein
MNCALKSSLNYGSHSKGGFVDCPFCIIRDNWITSIREGQFLCCHPQCWQIFPWRNVGGFEAVGVTDVQSAGDIIAAHHAATLARASVRNVGEEQIARWREDYVATWRNADRHVLRRQRRWWWGRPARDGSEIPYFLC